MIQPRDFLNLYVNPAIEDWRATPDAEHRAVAALIHIDVLAEVVFRHLKARGVYGVGAKAWKYRKELKQREPELGIAWDAHDSHKHGLLTEHFPRSMTAIGCSLSTLHSKFFSRRSTRTYPPSRGHCLWE